jgi:WD40 repeat protein
MTKIKFTSSAPHQQKSISWLNFENKTLVTGSYSESTNFLSIWKLEKELKLIQKVEHKGECLNIKVHKDIIYTASSNGSVYLFSDKLKFLESFVCHVGPTTCIDFSPSDSVLITSGEDGYINIIDSKGKITKIKADSLPIHCVRFQSKPF